MSWSHFIKRKFHIFKGFQMCVIIAPQICFPLDRSRDPEPTKPQLTFLFLIRKFSFCFFSLSADETLPPTAGLAPVIRLI